MNETTDMHDITQVRRILTFRVIRHVRYFLLSPTIITLLRKGVSLRILDSKLTGGMFSPPEVMMSSTKGMDMA